MFTLTSPPFAITDFITSQSEDPKEIVVISGSGVPSIAGAPKAIATSSKLQIIAAMAPAASAFNALSLKKHPPLSINATCPVRSKSGLTSKQTNEGLVGSSSKAIVTGAFSTGASSGAGPKPAKPLIRSPAMFDGSNTSIELPPVLDHKNICILGLAPSAGVAKFALFRDGMSKSLPSCASAFTKSFPPVGALPYWFC